MSAGDALPPILIMAQAEIHTPLSGLATYGPLGLWVLWMLWRDSRESTKQDKRHDENLAAQKRVEEAIRTNTNSILAAMAGVRHLDSSFSEMLERIKADNQNKP